jgi:sporulation protein YlmC with PRC-barrel domain
MQSMMRSLADFERYTVSATDGDVGSVADFLFEDERWVIRYLVVKTGALAHRTRVLISPLFFGKADWQSYRFHLSLPMAKVESSPNIDTDKPVSRQQEIEYYNYFGYPYYGKSRKLWGTRDYPGAMAAGVATDTLAEHADKATGDVHLRSAGEVRGYHVQGTDGVVGHIEDFIVDDHTWEVRYLVINTRDWWPGKKVLVAPRWVSSVSWEEKKVHVDLSRQAIKGSPEWVVDAAVNREYETRLYDYYGRPVYWLGGEPAEEQRAPHP